MDRCVEIGVGHMKCVLSVVIPALEFELVGPQNQWVDTMKARNGEWVGARPDVGSTVLLWMQDIACPKGIATEKRFLYRRGELWTGLWSG
jgi:hypothetical protein